MATTPTSERNADEGIQQFDFFGSNPNNPQPIPPSETGGVPAPVTETESPASSSEATGDNQTNTGTEPKHDPSRHEYWQREASLLRNELDKIKPFVPVARYVLENPQLLQTIEQDLKQKKAGPQGPPQLPKEPERPAEYSEEAAYSDPGSASFKYRVALDRHNSAKLDYLIKAQEYDKAQRETVVKQQQQQEQEYREVVRFRDAVMQQYGVPEQDANAFVDWYLNPQFTVDQGFQLYRMNKGMTPATSQGSQPRNTATRASGGPTPVGVTPAFNTNPPPSAESPDDGTTFMGSIMDTYYKRRGGKPK